MKRVFSIGPGLITALVLLLISGALVAKTPPPTYVKPGIDLSIYNKVLVNPLNVDNVKVLKPTWEQGNDEAWSIQPEVWADIQKWFLEALQRELETNGGYPMVSAPARDVLQIEVELLNITPYMKPGTRSGDGGDLISTLGSGNVVISAELRDSITRELLILVEGERSIGDQYKELSRENHIENVKGLFTKWGKKIRESLDEAHKK